MRSNAVVFLCRHCGLAFEASETELIRIEPLTAAVTTALAYPTVVRYLAVWRFAASVEVRSKQSRSQGPPGQVWEKVCRAAAPGKPQIYVPAFAFGRLVVKQLGVGLLERQPRLSLEPGIPPESPQLELIGKDGSALEKDKLPTEADFRFPDFGCVSPVLLSSADARVVAHYVYLALENQHTVDLRGIDYDLELGEGDLLYLPAVYDRRYVRDSGWRLLLREFDGLVA